MESWGGLLEGWSIVLGGLEEAVGGLGVVLGGAPPTLGSDLLRGLIPQDPQILLQQIQVAAETLHPSKSSEEVRGWGGGGVFTLNPTDGRTFTLDSTDGSVGWVFTLDPTDGRI